MIKVMHVVKSGGYSGAENVAIKIIKMSKDKVISTYTSPSGAINEYLSKEQIAHFEINKLNIKNIKKAITDCRPDIIHAHDFFSSTICALVCTKLPIISHLHNNSPWIKTLNYKSIAYRITSSKYKKIITVSDAIVKEYIFRNSIVGKTEIIGNPIDIGHIREQAGNEAIKFDVGFLGRMSQPKNPFLFVDIIEQLKNRIKNITAVMIGDGELRTEVEKRVVEKGLKSNILILGFQKNPYYYLNQIKVLCMPSIWEGYGLAAVEAISLGKPVICSNAGGLPSIIDESCGKVCYSVSDYCTSISELLENNDKYELKSRNAYVKAELFDNMDEYSRKILDIYNQVLE